jgi:hypothetical protein
MKSLLFGLLVFAAIPASANVYLEFTDTQTSRVTTVEAQGTLLWRQNLQVTSTADTANISKYYAALAGHTLGELQKLIVDGINDKSTKIVIKIAKVKDLDTEIAVQTERVR